MLKHSWIVLVLAASTARADPCGMVPPIWTGQGPAISRVGEQMTYAFFRDGVETFVIRPGFEGKVDNFGMLIPFPSPPAIRKVPDQLFDHIARAIDPPEVTVDLREPPPRPKYSRRRSAPSMAAPSARKSGGLAYDEVRVIKQEAVGMYEVTVLEAGSAKALELWMDRHGYVYPKGMDEPVNDYVALRWAFVAVKTRVGSKKQITPRPGMRRADPKLPAGASFDGKVQAMGFRFFVDEPVVPMRLSAFNDGQLRNIVYFLGDDPIRIRDLDTRMVRRQIGGRRLLDNLSWLPVRILGGNLMDISRTAWDGLDARRRAQPHNGHAATLFASDLLAVRNKKLALPFEEREKVLLRIDEALNLRGDAIDRLRHQVLEEEREQTLGRESQKVRSMTMTVVDGDFPREYLGEHNLTFQRYVMGAKLNNPATYHAVRKGPGPGQTGVVVYGNRRPPRGHPGSANKMRWFRSW